MPEADLPHHVRVAIVGAGFGGLGAAIRLIQDGERDLVVLEQADDVGGTWRDNTYPGCACDIPSVLYSFSFAPNPDWGRAFSYQPEIWDYLRACVDRFGLRPYLRLGVSLERAMWDDAAQHWRISTSRGDLTADVLVSATGSLSEPRIPDLPGLDTFAGPVFHSARWRHDHDLTGRSVAVVGTGASAIQFVPQIASQVRQLTVFQRTAPWVIPRSNPPVGAGTHQLYRRFPLAQRAVRTGVYAALEVLALALLHPRLGRVLQRVARSNLRRQVTDPTLRAALTPDYSLGCKRILYSADYLPTLQQDNVRVETTAVARVLPNAVVGADGIEHLVDTIILGTGFHVTDAPTAGLIVGRDGQTLAAHWQGSPQAYNTVTVHGFPNLFLLLGPNSGLGHNSVVIMAEAGIEHLRVALRHLRTTGAAALQPSAQAQAAFVREVDRRMTGTVWTSGGCRSWYLDVNGRNSAIWPGFTGAFRRRLARLRPEDYELHPEEGRGVSALAGRVVLVTGAARGIGEAVAREVAARGGRLALIGLEPARLQRLSVELSGPGAADPGSEHVWAEADVTDQAALEKAVAIVSERLGRIDVVVANAGIANTGTVATNPADALARTVEVNLVGVIRTVSTTLPAVLATRGHYLLVASAASFTSVPGLAAYAASKSGVGAFADAFRLEVAHRGVTVGSAHPIWVDTDLVRDAKADLPIFRRSIEQMPPPLGTQVDVATCARLMVDGIERRRRKVFVPRALAVVFHARAVLTTRLVGALMERAAARSVPRLEEQVVGLGRSFGAHSAADPTADVPVD